MNNNIINNFQKEYRFLSNFWPCDVEYDGIVFPSVEHAYQASKSLDPIERVKISKMKKPSEAKGYGQTVKMPPYFNEIRYSVMKELVAQKFNNDQILKRKLLTTKGKILIEGNTWHDNYWGSCYCSKCGGNGLNMLGKILMEVRDSLTE